MPVIYGTPLENSINEIEVMSVGYTTEVPPNPDWIKVDQVPYPQDYPHGEIGERVRLIYNRQTKGFRFDVVPRELTPEEQKDKALNDAIDILIEEGLL